MITSNITVTARKVQSHSRKIYFCRIFRVTSPGLKKMTRRAVYQYYMQSKMKP